MIDIRYVAGFFDGEGCIGIARYRKGRGHYVLHVSLAQKMRGVLEELQARFGGSLRTMNRDPKWADITMWCIGAKKAEVFLQAIVPYLKVKKKQAEIALRYRTLVSYDHGVKQIGRRKGNPMPEEIRQQMEQCRNEIMALNYRGPVLQL